MILSDIMRRININTTQCSNRDESIKQYKSSRSRKITEEGVGAWAAYCMIMNIYVGFGIVAIPYAIASGGWLSLVLIPIMGFLAWLTGIQITKSFVVSGVNTYEDLGRVAAGRLGYWWVFMVIVLSVLIIIVYVDLLAQNILNTLPTGIMDGCWNLSGRDIMVSINIQLGTHYYCLGPNDCTKISNNWFQVGNLHCFYTLFLFVGHRG